MGLGVAVGTRVYVGLGVAMGGGVYVGKGEIPRIYGGIGTAIISTSQGVMTGRQAWRTGVGGELLGYVW